MTTLDRLGQFDPCTGLFPSGFTIALLLMVGLFRYRDALARFQSLFQELAYVRDGSTVDPARSAAVRRL